MSTASAANRSFERYFLPKLAGRLIEEVSKRDVLAILDDLVGAGHPIAANRARAVASAFFNWAISRDIIVTSPCTGVKPPSVPRFRDRVLSDDELRWLWKACEATPSPFGRMVQLLILTGARRDEVRGINEKELNLSSQLWIFHADRAKNHRSHEIHLTELALNIIAAVPRVKNPSGLLFSTNGETPPSGFSRAKSRIDHLMLKHAQGEVAANGADPASVEIPEWVFHDLRRTMATGMARLVIQLPVIERCLNHVSGSFSGIVGVYQRHSFAQEKQAAFETWASHVSSVLGNATSSNVITMRKNLRATN